MRLDLRRISKKGEISVKYNALTIGLADDLLANLQMCFNQHSLHFHSTTTVRERDRLLHSQIFHLIC